MLERGSKLRRTAPYCEVDFALLRDEADYFGLVGLVEACDADQAPEPIVAKLDAVGEALVLTLGSLTESIDYSTNQLVARISPDPAQSLYEVLTDNITATNEIAERISDDANTPLNDVLSGIKTSLEEISTHIYNPHGTNDLYSAIRDRG